MFTVKKIQIKICKGKQRMGQKVRKKLGANFQVFSPGGVTQMHWILATTMCDNTCQVWPTREVHRSLGVQGFYWGSAMKACSTCVADCSYSVRLQAPESRKQVFNINHTVSANYLSKLVLHGPRPQRRKNTLIRQTDLRAQSSSPRSWPRANPDHRPFYRMCRIWANQVCWLILSCSLSFLDHLHSRQIL